MTTKTPDKVKPKHVKKLDRSVLPKYVRYFLIIMISWMTMVSSVHASGALSGQTWSCVDYWNQQISATGPDPIAACKAVDIKTGYYNASFVFTNMGGSTTWVSIQICGNIPPWGPGSCTNQHAALQGCPTNATPMPAANSPICTCNTGYQPDSAGTSCVLNQEQYTLALTPTSATIEPGQSYTFTAQVTKQDGSAPGQSVPVSVKVEVDPISGGHAHGETYATRPKGGVSPASGNNSLSITFTSTEVSGTHTITATCDLCVNKTAAARVDVKIPGLIAIQSTPVLYSLIGAVEDKHTDNHYLTPSAVDRIWGIAADYHMNRTFWQPSAGGIKKQIPPPPLGLNDASLIWGGKFDLSGKWSGSHYEHDKGVVIDIRANGTSGSVPQAQFPSFEELTADKGFKTILECTSNRVDGQGRTPPSCIGRDGSSDSNRHYHIKIN